MKTKLVLVALAVFTITLAPAQGQKSYFTEQGSMWFGGSIDLASFAARNFSDRTSSITAYPMFRYFPLDYLFIGPVINYRKSESLDNSKSHNYGLGGDIGYAEINKKLLAVGYFKTGLHYNIHYKDSEKISDGIALPISIGAVIPIKRVIWVNIEPGFTYRWQENSDDNVFSLGFGFSMMNKKALITVLGY